MSSSIPIKISDTSLNSQINNESKLQSNDHTETKINIRYNQKLISISLQVLLRLN